MQRSHTKLPPMSLQMGKASPQPLLAFPTSVLSLQPEQPTPGLHLRGGVHWVVRLLSSQAIHLLSAPQMGVAPEQPTSSEGLSGKAPRSHATHLLATHCLRALVAVQSALVKQSTHLAEAPCPVQR